jgi:YesN/AraC family two-component response regulator
MMGYSSVQYLSTQFKNITGITVSEFKKEFS